MKNWQEEESKFIETWTRGLNPRLSEREILGAIALLGMFFRDSRIEYAKEKCIEMKDDFENNIAEFHERVSEITLPDFQK